MTDRRSFLTTLTALLAARRVVPKLKPEPCWVCSQGLAHTASSCPCGPTDAWYKEPLFHGSFRVGALRQIGGRTYVFTPKVTYRIEDPHDQP